MSDPKPSTASAKSKILKPRAGVVRKSKAERDAHAKEEAERAAARAAVAEQSTGKPDKSTKPVRKRDAPRDNRDGGQSTSGGVFGTGSGVRSGWRKSVMDAGHSEMLEGQESVKPSEGPKLQGQDNITDGSGRQGGGGGAGSGGAGPSGRSAQMMQSRKYENESESDDARDIEFIFVSEDEEVSENGDVVGASAGKQRATSRRGKRQDGGLRPVTLPGAASDESDTDSEDMKTAASNPVGNDDADEEGHGEEIDSEQVADPSVFKHDPPSSPELSKRQKTVRRPGAKPKSSKPINETVEEKSERRRLRKDVEQLRAEFAQAPKVKRDGDAMEDEDDRIRHDRLYLFQLPPLVPFLDDPTSAAAVGQDNKQQEPQAEPGIKTEPDRPAHDVSEIPEASKPGSTAPKPQMEGMFTAEEPLRLPAGRVGKLQIHKSGKITLDWAGVSLEVRSGTDVDFLQDAVLVETPSEPDRTNDDGENSASLTGNAYALGQIKKKMIIIPDWQKLYD